MGCEGNSVPSTSGLASSPSVDTTKVPNCFDIYQIAFGSDTLTTEWTGLTAATKSTVGQLHITSGSFAIGDQVLLPHLQPCAQKVPAGDYDVEVVKVRHPQDPKFAINALMRVRFNELPPVSWKFASSNKAIMDTVSVHSENFVGFSVDAGSAILYDQSKKTRIEDLELDQLWTDGIKVTKDFVAFSTNGDGRFPAYLGFDRDGNPCQLVIDLMLINCTCN
jgi:hypothetical protein